MLRECRVCNGTDEALLKGGGDNELTFLLARLFHCVKLPVDVMEEDHPFHVLFTQKQPEHLFICAPDGSGHDPLESQTSRKELWDSMRKMVASEYEGKLDRSLKDLAKLMNELDLVDARLSDLRASEEKALIDDGPKSRKLPKLAKKIAKEEKKLKKLREDIDKASKLSLKPRVFEAAKKAKAGASEERAEAAPQGAR